MKRSNNFYNAVVLTSLAISILFLALAFVGIKSCAVGKSGGETCQEKITRPASCPVGQTGTRVEICHANAWTDSFNNCKAGGGDCKEAVFNRNVAPLITSKCVSCHPGFDQFDTAKTKIDNFITRTSLPPDDAQRMPKAPNVPLADTEKAVLVKWKSDGLLPACKDDTQIPHTALGDLEQDAFNDINSLNSGTQRETRWLYTAHKSNEGATKEVLKQFEAAIQKGINNISSKRSIVLAKAVNKNGTLFRFNLNDLGLTVAAWNLIEANDPINLESASLLGNTLKGLTDSKKPLMSVDAFLASSTKAAVYYSVKKIPNNLKDFLTFIGVDANAQIDNFQSSFIGFATSSIAEGKNRLIARFEGTQGAAYFTFDTTGLTVKPPAKDPRNLFQFPLLRSISKTADFKFDANEVIASNPNSTHIYALFDAAGKLLSEAAINIVSSNVHPPANPIIFASVSCTRCHNAGYIPKQDEVKNAVNEAAITFDLRDVDQVNLLYRDPSAAYSADNAQYGEALSKMGILPTDPDPINVSIDNLQERPLNAKAVASLLLLTEEEFKFGLSKSAQGTSQVGQLLSGGTITFEQLKNSLPTLIKDLRIGQDPLNP